MVITSVVKSLKKMICPDIAGGIKIDDCPISPSVSLCDRCFTFLIRETKGLDWISHYKMLESWSVRVILTVHARSRHFPRHHKMMSREVLNAELSGPLPVESGHVTLPGSSPKP